MSSTTNKILHTNIGIILLNMASQPAVRTLHLSYTQPIQFSCNSVTALLTTLKIPKMVPMDTPQSMLEDPSRGSKVTMYLPRCAGFSTTIACSSSSETSNETLPEAINELRKMSLARTSNFLTSSP